ncbi:FixH family protein [Sulfurimonas sp. SAG-AH-194-I05]|nr:FixH family protein [Sulfurimonas sp. SAG-AH-194-I05]MDF1874255.1 FixH family protein [Sulfurimonas sp. SAG-AH-194-I05]
MKTITKIFLALLLGATIAQGAAFQKVAKSRATQIQVTSEKPLSTGNNTLYFEVGHKNYKDSQMTVKVFMPAMPGMPYMENKTQAKSLGNGKFVADVNIAMSGTWQVHIFLTPKTGKKVRVKTSLNI